MRHFISEIYQRNRLLCIFGWLCLAGALICMSRYTADIRFVAGVNLWLKPIKFFLSVAIFSFTMSWYLHYLQMPRTTRIYSRMVVMVMSFELFVITWQAYHGRLSHYNNSTPLYASLFAAMGIAIVILTGWTAYIGYLFFRKKSFEVPMSYIWGIRLGIILFVLFSFEGGLMAARLAHSVGGPDGSPGLPFVNWSSYFGDLRVAHFFGIHSLQLLPLFGWYSTRKPKNVIVFSSLYFVMVVLLLLQAYLAIPFI